MWTREQAKIFVCFSGLEVWCVRQVASLVNEKIKIQERPKIRRMRRKWRGRKSSGEANYRENGWGKLQTNPMGEGRGRDRFSSSSENRERENGKGRRRVGLRSSSKYGYAENKQKIRVRDQQEIRNWVEDTTDDTYRHMSLGTKLTVVVKMGFGLLDLVT